MFGSPAQGIFGFKDYDLWVANYDFRVVNYDLIFILKLIILN